MIKTVLKHIFILLTIALGTWIFSTIFLIFASLSTYLAVFLELFPSSQYVLNVIFLLMLVVIFYGKEIKQNGKIQKVIKNIGLFLIATVLSVLALLFYAYIYNDVILKDVKGELFLFVKAVLPPVGVIGICSFIFFIGYFF